MPDIFTGSPGDAAHFLEQWRQFLEELLQSETQEPDPETRGLQIYDNEQLVFGIDPDTQQFKDEVTGVPGQILNPELLKQLEQLRDTPIGGVVAEAPNKRIELDGKIVLQSDSQGKVIINKILSQKSPVVPVESETEFSSDSEFEAAASEREEYLAASPEPEWEDEYLSEPREDEWFEKNLSEPREDEWFEENLPESQELDYSPNDLIPVGAAIEPDMGDAALVSAVREGIQSENYQKIEQAYTGVPYQQKERVFNSLTPDEQKEAKLLKLIQQVEELSGITDGSVRMFVRQAMSQRQSQPQPQQRTVEPEPNLHQKSKREQGSTVPGYERVSQSLEALPQTPTVQMATSYTNQMQALLGTIEQHNQLFQELEDRVDDMQQLIAARKQEPMTLNWWQHAKQAIANLWDRFKRREENHTYAAAIRSLYAQKALPDSSTLYTNNYIIQRDGRNYTLSDQDGRTILRFQASNLGVQLDSDVQLQPEQQRDLAQLVAAQAKGRQPSEAFAIAGQVEGNYVTRVQRVATALVDYARFHKSEVEIDGRLSYKWKANPIGDVEIHAKDGRGTLFLQSGGRMLAQLSERDLAYFEAVVPRLQSEISRSPKQPQSRAKNHEIGDSR